MKTRAAVIYKATELVLLAALTLVICFPVAAATNNTTLTTTVPGTIPLLLDLTGNGTVTIDGVGYTQSDTIKIPKNPTVKLQITPDAENDIKSVIYNGQDYTKEAKNGNLTLPPITGEAILCVSFTKTSSTPQTGGPYSPLYLIFLMYLSLTGMITVLSFRKKSTN